MEALLEHLGNHPWLAGAAGLLMLAVIGYELRQRAHAAAAVSPAEAIRLMNGGAVLVDVRGVAQYRDGHIGGARNVPGDQLETAVGGLEKFRDRVLITCCDTGTASGAAARKLAAQGFSKVFNLRGGLAAWRQDNLPLVKG